MEGIKIEVSYNMAKVTRKPMTITSGTVGMPVEFTFDSDWDGLGKMAVFKAGNEKRIKPIVNGEVTLPWEVLEVPKMWLSVGVYGTNAEGTLVIPTIWENVCVIRAGADADGDPSADPTPPVWDQLNAEFEKLRDAIENGDFEGAPGKDGAPGEDGFSPRAKVEQTASGAVITIEDVSGTTTATVVNGRDGKDGIDGSTGEQGPQGEPGPAGPAGKDGPTVDEVLSNLLVVNGLDFSEFENGTFTEIIAGQAFTHSVYFDNQGRPIGIDDVNIIWEDT